MSRNHITARMAALTGMTAMATVSAPALAQSETAAEDKEEILVTGSRFQNSLVNRLPIEPRELPFSLNIVDKSVMEERGFINPLDVLETVPNVVRVQTQLLPTGGSYFIRGLYASVLTNNRPENDSRGAGRRTCPTLSGLKWSKAPPRSFSARSFQAV